MSAEGASGSWLFPWVELANECKDDARIRVYVAPRSSQGENAARMVQWPGVLTEFRQDRAFADATTLESYAAYAALAHAATLAAICIRDMTRRLSWPALRSFLATRWAIGLVLSLALLALYQRDYVAFAGQVTAFPVALAAGLTWRSAQASGSLAALGLAIALGTAGIAALVAPLALGLSVPYPSWVLAGILLGVAWVLAQDHSRRPLLRGFKAILLTPAGYSAERRASQAREEWLADAREKAIMPELVQAINRLLPSDHKKRLFVEEAPGLSETYHPSLQVPTSAARRVEQVLRSSDGASIAVSGPRGCGKTALLKELCQDPSRLRVLVPAPTRYAPNEFLIDLFQRLCEKYIEDQGFPAERAGTLPFRTRVPRLPRGTLARVTRVALAVVLLGLLAWVLIARSVNYELSWLSQLPAHLWADKRLLTSIALVAGIIMVLPKRRWPMPRRRSEQSLVAEARRYLLELRAEQTATTQIGGGLPVLQAAFSREVELRSLPWSMPELVRHLCDFIEKITQDSPLSKPVLICIDEVDRIGSTTEATRFLSEIKAVFGAPRCYFVVAIAEEFGATFSQRAITGRSLADNIFDEVISVEPMPFELSKQLLQRRVPGFTASFVWLSLALSGGVPRELIRAARRLVETAIESDYEFRLPEFARRLVGEGIREASMGTRAQIAQLLPGREWGPALDKLRLLTATFGSDTKPSDFHAALQELADLPASLPDTIPREEIPVKDAVAKLAALAFLGLTTWQAFQDTCYDVAGPPDSATDPSGPFAELAAAQRELSVSAESCRTAVSRIRTSLNLDHS